MAMWEAFVVAADIAAVAIVGILTYSIPLPKKWSDRSKQAAKACAAIVIVFALGVYVLETGRDPTDPKGLICSVIKLRHCPLKVPPPPPPPRRDKTIRDQGSKPRNPAASSSQEGAPLKLDSVVAAAVRQADQAQQKAYEIRDRAVAIAREARQAGELAKDAVMRAKRGDRGYGQICGYRWPESSECGRQYFGQIVDGKREGYGMDGCAAGHWHNDLEDGVGLIWLSCTVNADGITDNDPSGAFAGQWGRGHARVLGVSGPEAGEFVDGRMDGYAVDTFTYGGEWAGQFVNGHLEGYAVRKNAFPQETWKGQFKGDALNGLGAIYSKDGRLIQQGSYRFDYLLMPPK